jgi:hypothetical protein
MQNPVEIENIEEVRRREGINDVELRREIRGLAISDLVKVTLLSGTTAFETLAVRITSIRGSAFRGKLVDRPASPNLSRLRAGSAIAFTAAHIHSIPRRLTHEQ